MGPALIALHGVTRVSEGIVSFDLEDPGALRNRIPRPLTMPGILAMLVAPFALAERFEGDARFARWATASRSFGAAVLLAAIEGSPFPAWGSSRFQTTSASASASASGTCGSSS